MPKKRQLKEYVFTTMIINRNREEIEVNIEGMVHYDVESNYGADADGNRGTRMTIVEDVVDIGASSIITDEDVEFTIQLPADPVVVVNDIVEIEITFEGTDGEFVITDVVFVGIVL